MLRDKKKLVYVIRDVDIFSEQALELIVLTVHEINCGFSHLNSVLSA